MKSSFTLLTKIMLFWFCEAALAVDCAAPPVTDAIQAICLARQFVEKPTPPTWELQYEVKETEQDWLVYYSSKSSSVRGGAGDLKVDKKSGEVVFVQGYR
jgi:hypothetical protein